MKNEIKQDYRAAVAILQSLQDARQSLPMDAMDDSIEQVNRWRRRLEMATMRNWHIAAKDAASKLRAAFDNLRLRSVRAMDDLTKMSGSRIEPTALSIFRDIEGLRDEFEVVKIDRANQQLTVRIANIELEGVQLGEFEVRLNWKFMKASSPYNVIAIQPNRPSSNSGITHPHVQGHVLCEGEGADAIRRALDEGRLHDFFCIVDNVLRSYNPDSAYVQMEDWSGVSCNGCGDNVDSDDVIQCRKCQTELCLDCSTSCETCCDRYCSECLSSCQCCGEDLCKDCMTSCDDCGEEFCKSCLFEGTCDDCISQQNEASQEDGEDEDSEQQDAAVHAVCDGEAAVPA